MIKFNNNNNNNNKINRDYKIQNQRLSKIISKIKNKYQKKKKRLQFKKIFKN